MTARPIKVIVIDGKEKSEWTITSTYVDSIYDVLDCFELNTSDLIK